MHWVHSRYFKCIGRMSHFLFIWRFWPFRAGLFMTTSGVPPGLSPNIYCKWKLDCLGKRTCRPLTYNNELFRSYVCSALTAAYITPTKFFQKHWELHILSKGPGPDADRCFQPLTAELKSTSMQGSWGFWLSGIYILWQKHWNTLDLNQSWLIGNHVLTMPKRYLRVYAKKGFSDSFVCPRFSFLPHVHQDVELCNRTRNGRGMILGWSILPPLISNS